jgi:hypothetical protein
MQFRIIIISVVACVTVIAACGSKTQLTPDASVDAYFSKCGHPGDPGNELMIGKFCASQSDCGSIVTAPLCSSLGDPMTHFCTKTCSSTGSAGQCGTVTTCACNAGNQCGCTPNACLGP